MQYKHELIMVIVNSGFSSEVMEVAKKAGATGGTILHARGTANKEAEEFFKITVEPDKEIILLVVKTQIKEAVLKKIYEDVGLNSPGQGIAFSLPISNTVGLINEIELEKKEE